MTAPSDGRSVDESEIKESILEGASRRTLLGLCASGATLGGALSFVPDRSRGAELLTTESVSGQHTAQSGVIWELQSNFFAEDGEDRDRFGHRVAISKDGSTALVSAEEDENDTGDFDPGAAYVFVNEGDGWTQQAKLLSNTTNDFVRFGQSVSLSADGSTAVVGSPNENVGDTDSGGAVYLYFREDGTWTEGTQITEVDPRDYNQLGTGVALTDDGSAMVVGADGHYHPDVGNEPGAAVVFVSEGDSWAHQATVFANNLDAVSNYGSAVDVSADIGTFVVGSVGGDSTRGSAWVLDSEEDTRNQQTLTPEDSDPDSKRFGRDVAIDDDGTTVLVGAEASDSVNGEGTGATYVFVRDGDSWTQQAKLLATDEDGGDRFGQSVSLSADGTTALIGEPLDDNRGDGAAYIFVWDGDTWEKQTKINENRDPVRYFGWSVSLAGDGTTALIGSMADEDPDGEETGSGYIFEQSEGETGPTASFSFDPASPTVDQEVFFDATDSSTSDGSITEYRWDLTGDGQRDETTALPDANYIYEESGDYDVSLTVIDTEDKSDTTTNTVSVSSDDGGPPALPGEANQPQDPDGDGVYEDLDGDGEVSLSDVRLYYRALYQEQDSDYVQENKQFFDLTGDGEITLADLQALFEQRS